MNCPMKKPPIKASLTRLLLSLSCSLLFSACSDNKPSMEEQDACFHEYIDKYKEEYPEATLRKTAALKCYQ